MINTLTIDFIGRANDIIVKLYNSGLNNYKRRRLYHGNDYSAWAEIAPPPSHDVINVVPYPCFTSSIG
jgi:hypothetical protein